LSKYTQVKDATTRALAKIFMAEAVIWESDEVDFADDSGGDNGALNPSPVFKTLSLTLFRFAPPPGTRRRWWSFLGVLS